jgi:predicted amidohydrolase
MSEGERATMMEHVGYWSALAEEGTVLAFGIWIALATQAGSTVDEDFPGLAALVSPDGTVVDRLPDWHEGALIVDIPL